MDKLRIFNIALTLYNMEPLTEEQLNDSDVLRKHPEVAILEIGLPIATRKAMRERCWTFLDAELELGEDLGPDAGYTHSYKLPDGLFRVTRADGIYSVKGNKLLTNGQPIAFGQMSTLPDTGVPEDFYDLIGYALALFAGPKLSSGDSKTNYAASFYSTILSSMIATDASDSIRENSEVANGYGSYV